jgi:hypothetical protein
MDFIPSNDAKTLPPKFSLKVKKSQSPSETSRGTWKDYPLSPQSVSLSLGRLLLQHKGASLSKLSPAKYMEWKNKDLGVNLVSNEILCNNFQIYKTEIKSNKRW